MHRPETRTERRDRARLGAALGAGVIFMGLGLLALTECTETLRDLGQGCLRNGDCVSGYCAGQICVAQPPVFDAAPPFDAGMEAAADVAADVHDAGTPEVITQDTSMPPGDTGTDVHADAPDAPADAPADAPPRDGTADARDGAPAPDAQPDVVDAAAPPG